MGTTADAEVVIRMRDAQFGEEHVAHFGVVMLAGMRQHFPPRRAVFAEGAGDDGGFDEMRAVAPYGRDFEGAFPALSYTASTSVGSP